MIFNKSNNGSEEIKGMIGWIYKSNSFDNLSTYIRMAERQVIQVVGKEVYKLANDHYKSSDYEAEDQTNLQIHLDDLVHNLQLPIALLAYRKYAPGVDLQHSESGRQITVTNELKPAFEWMIERDNCNIIDLYHESIEILLEFLDEQDEIEEIQMIGEPAIETPVLVENDIQTAWRGSAEFSATKSLFINTAGEFDSVYPINNSRRLYMAMISFIRETENQFIRPALVASTYDAIKEKVKDKETLTEQEKKMIELSKVPIALFTMSKALKRLNIEVLPDRVIQNYSSFDPKQNATAVRTDRVGLSALLESDAYKSLIPLQNYIKSLSTVTETEEVTDTTKPFFLA